MKLQSILLFLVPFIDSAQPTALYYRADYLLNHLVDGGITGLVIADVNNDGKLDFVAGAGFGIDVSLGNGDGTFKPMVSFIPSGSGLPAGAALSWSAADFDGDGNVDLALYSQGSVFVLPGNGDGTFGSARLAASGLGFPAPFPSNQRLAAADLNHDGHPDLVWVASASSGTVNASATVLLNNGNGTFTPHAALNLPSNEYAVGVTVADFNRDGVPDLAVIGQVLGGFGPPPAVPGHVYIGLGKGDGSFSAPLAPVPLGATPSFIAAADFNHDGTPDLAVQGGFTSIFLGNGDGSFRAEPTLNIGIGNPGSIAVGDWTGSGNPGLALFSPITPAGIALLASNADGTFSSAGTAGIDPHTGQITGLLSADLNADGRPDLVVLGQANTVSVLLNAGDSPPQIVLPVSAASDIQAVAPGSIATIFGQFPVNGTQSNSVSPAPTQLAGASVSVQDSAGITRAAPLFFVSPTQINLLIPAGTSSGVAQMGVVVNGAPPIPGVALVRNVVPAIFTLGGSEIAAAYAVTYGPDNQPQSQQLAGSCQASCAFTPIPRPAGTRVFLELYATGIRNHVSPVAVAIMGGQGVNQTVTPEYAGPQGQFDGLDQVNVEITSLPAQPPSPSGTIYNLVLSLDGLVSNTILFAVE